MHILQRTSEASALAATAASNPLRINELPEARKRFASFAKVHKLQRHRVLLAAHGGDHALQFVPALSRNADFRALDLCRHLEFAVADKAGHLLGRVLLETLLNLDHLPRVAKRGNLRLVPLDVFQAD